MGLSGHEFSGRRAAAGVLLLCAVLAVQLYIYSPWHKHPQGRQSCSFNPVEHSSGSPPSGALRIAAPAMGYGAVTVEAARPASPFRIAQLPSRAPPACQAAEKA